MIKELVMLQRFPPPPGMQPGQNARADMLRRLSAGGFARAHSVHTGLPPTPCSPGMLQKCCLA